MTGALDKLYAILQRDLLTAIRRRAGFAFILVGLLAELSAFYFLARAIGPGFRPGGVEYFPFLLVGTGVYTFFVMTTQAFLTSIQEAQQTGTMEVLMTTSTPPVQLLVLSSMSTFGGSLVNLAAYLVAGVLIFRASLHANWPAVAVVLILSLILALALGIAAASLQVSFQRGSALMWLLSSGLWFLSGAMFPIDKLPKPVMSAAQLFPLYYSVEAMRRALLQAQTLADLGPVLTPLLVFGIALLALSLYGFSYSLRRARQSGTLSFY